MTDLQSLQRDQFRNEIKASSNKRILRKQLELLAEVSHSEIELGLPELTKSMLDIHDRLERSKLVFTIFVLTIVLFFHKHHGQHDRR